MRLLLTLLLIICHALPAYTAGEPQIHAQLSATEFSIHQGSLLSITIIGDRNPKVQLPEIEGVQFQSRGKSSQLSYVNGAMSSSLSLQYVVTADKEGDYSLAPISAEIDGDTYYATPLSFTVHKIPNPVQEDGTDLSFIETKLKSPVYLGELIPVDIHVFFSRQHRVKVNSPPRIIGDELSMTPFTQNPLQQQAQRKGNIYNELIWSTELSSVSSGTFPITFQLDASILKKEDRGSLGGFGDPFVNSMLSTTTSIPLQVMSKSQEITILPLPTINQPADFSGAVGQFTLDVQATTKTADVGEPVQVTITLNGKGNFDLVHTPQIMGTPQWKSYPAQKIDTQQVKYQKVFQQVVVAKEAGQITLPKYSFSYFDPEKKHYVTLHSKQTSLDITGTNAKAPTLKAPIPMAKSDEIASDTPQAVNLVEQHLQVGKTYQEIKPLFLKKWFIALLCILIICLIYFVVLFIYNKRKENNAPHYQQRALYKELKQNCLTIQKEVDANEFHNAQNNIIQLLQRYFAFHLQKEAHSISPYSLRSMTNDLDLVNIFNSLSSASYTGILLSTTELTQMLDAIETRLEETS